jgi:hypothetical protein
MKHIFLVSFFTRLLLERWGWQDSAHTFSKSDDLPALSGACATDGDGVSINEELADLAIGELDFLLARSIDLEERPQGIALLARYGSGAQKISGVHRAAADSVVGKHLWERPEEIRCRGLGDGGASSVGCFDMLVTILLRIYVVDLLVRSTSNLIS